MRLLSPWALWFLSFMPLVVLMYILKQRFEERQIGSIYLWQQVLKDIEVNTPWQKLKKNLLLFLQLLSILFLVLALSDPYIYTGGGMYSNLVIVVDNTGSMNAGYEGTTRLEAAKQHAEERINRSGAKVNITLLSAGRNPKVEVGNTTDKGEAIDKLRAIGPSNSYGNINDSVSLVKAMVKQHEGSSGYEAVFYTDSPINIEDVNAEVVSLASELENASLDYISYSGGNGKLTALVRATNRSKVSLMREISLYGNDVVLGIKSIELPAGETRTVYFEEVSTDAPYIWAEFTEKDDLQEDNQVYGIVKSSKPSKVLLISKGNVFIEKALSNINGVELYKTSPEENINEGYNLYIYDSVNPGMLPKSGSILLINPPAGNGIVDVGAELAGGAAHIEKHVITRYMENAEFTVAKLKSMEAPYWSDILINVAGHAAAISGEYKGRRASAISFDLHNSDFPLTTEYPIFIYNLAAYLIGIEAENRASYLCGDAVELNTSPEADQVSIKDPEGAVYSLELEHRIQPFDNTEKLGVYQLIQKLDETELISSFSVNFPSAIESVNYLSLEAQANKATSASKAFGGIGLQDWLIGLLLLAAAVEWVVFIRGY